MEMIGPSPPVLSLRKEGWGLGKGPFEDLDNKLGMKRSRARDSLSVKAKKLCGPRFVAPKGATKVWDRGPSLEGPPGDQEGVVPPQGPETHGRVPSPQLPTRWGGVKGLRPDRTKLN